MRNSSVYKKERELKKRYLLLRDWYGEENARSEMAAHCPAPENLADIAREVVSKALGPDLGARMKLEENWGQIAGEFIAKITQVGFYRKGALTVEVSHPLYLRELESATDLLIDKINEFGIKCTELHFAPASRKRKE